MSTLLIMRANRVLLFSMAAVLIASLVAPLTSVANADFAAGDSAVVSNGGNGAYLRNDTAVLDDTTITAELPDGAIVYVTDGPYSTDTGVWVWVETDSAGGGFISTDLLVKSADSEEVVSEGEAATEEADSAPVSELPALEPIDGGTVVDNNILLSADGLPVHTDASHDAPVIGYAPVGSWFDVTSERVWIGESNFVRVNFNGVGGYVDGQFIALESEVTVEAPEEEVIWVDEEPTEVPTEEVIETEVVVETEVPTEVVVETEIATEVVVETEVATETVVETEVPTEVVVETDVATEVVDETEVPTETIVETEVPTEVVVETDVATEVVVETEVPTETAVETEVPTEAVVETEVVPGTPIATEVTTPAQTVTVEATQAPTKVVAATVTAPATSAPTKTATVAPTKEAAAVKTPAPTPVVIASSAKKFDATKMIGSATVTGTNNGLVCRSAPNASASVLMTLREGTKVLVSEQAVNGYLGIDCGGLQGFADVNYLWSGGAGDAEITAAKMNVVVTGTGNGLNCRSTASLGGSVITTVADGTTMVTRGKATNGWTPVVCAGKNGFVSTTWIEAKAGSTGATTALASSGSAKVNTGGDGLYCRTGAGTTYGVITVLSNGSTVAIRGARQGSWLPVTCGGAKGFVSTSFVTTMAGSASTSLTSATSSRTGKVTVSNTGGSGLNCRAGAGTNHSVITVLSLGQTVTARSGSVSGWTAVVCGGKNGFISSQFATGGGAATTTGTSTSTTSKGTAKVNAGGDGLYCRSGAGSSYGVITVLASGASVATRGAAQNGWVPVVCGGANGWASATFLTLGSSTASSGTTTTTPSGLRANDHAKATSSVNLRYSASTTSNVATVVNAGVVVKITGSVTNNFYPVNYDGLTGFIHKDYLVKTTAALSERGGSGATTTPKPSAPTSASGNAVVNYAMRYVGYPYVWATHGPASFDCSGFTYWVVKNVLGKDIGYGTWTQAAAGTPVSKSNLQAGDLVFFQNTYTAGLSHVGVYIGNGQFIHAQNEETGVVVSDLNSSYYGPRWFGAVRL